MSTVASAPAMNGNHETTRDSVEQSPSRFTAVNGKEQPTSHRNGTPDFHTPPTHERENSRDCVRASEQPAPPNRKESLVPSTTNIAPRDRNENGMSTDRHSPAGNRNKRKRSDSIDQQASPPVSRHTRSVSGSPTARTDNDTLHRQSVDSNGVSRQSTSSDRELSARKEYSTGVGNEQVATTTNNHAWESYDSRNQDQVQHQVDSSDVQLAEALQRDVHGPDSSTKSWESPVNGAQNESPNPHPAQLANYTQSQAHAQTPAEPRRHSSSQRQSQTPSQGQSGQAAAKRKRVFSNRTKTGCMTCRRRKKKCDEQHPSCNNCIRGGFPCEGYSVRSTWQKPSNPKGPVPLQSKDRYPEVSNPYMNEMSPQHQNRVPQAVLQDGSKARPVSVDEGDRNVPQYITSPTSTSARSSWPKGSWPASGPGPYIAEAPPKPEFRDGQVMKELPRPEQPKADYNVPPLRELSHNTHPKAGMAVFQSNMDQRQNHPPRVDPANYSAQARLALTMEPLLEPNGKTEKDKMLSGEPYRPFDPQLERERERCETALWRFTNAGNPVYGISKDERMRLFKEILMPPVDPQTESNPNNPLGPGFRINPPFRCHYGYNINIGEDVDIGENCFFADDCTITIGAHTTIGVDVKILTSMPMAGMQERKGSKSRHQGRPVVIAEDCYLGPGCMILPGVTLGRGAYIAPGEVVRSQILPYGFQGLQTNYP